MAENHKMFGDPLWLSPPLRRPDPGASGGDWPGNLVGVIFRRWRIYLASRVAGGWPVMPPLVQNSTARKWFQNDPTQCSRFWSVFPRVLELKMVF